MKVQLKSSIDYFSPIVLGLDEVILKNPHYIPHEKVIWPVGIFILGITSVLFEGKIYKNGNSSIDLFAYLGIGYTCVELINYLAVEIPKLSNLS